VFQTPITYVKAQLTPKGSGFVGPKWFHKQLRQHRWICSATTIFTFLPQLQVKHYCPNNKYFYNLMAYNARILDESVLLVCWKLSPSVTAVPTQKFYLKHFQITASIMLHESCTVHSEIILQNGRMTRT